VIEGPKVAHNPSGIAPKVDTDHLAEASSQYPPTSWPSAGTHDLIDELKRNLLPVPPEKRAENICLMKAIFNSGNNVGKAGSSAMAIIRPNLDSQSGKYDGIQAYRALNHHHTGKTNYRRRSSSHVFFEAKQKQGETALAYYGRINEITSTIRSQGGIVDDQMVNDCFLRTLLPMCDARAYIGTAGRRYGFGSSVGLLLCATSGSTIFKRAVGRRFMLIASKERSAISMQ
jgi:hypothetical protein